MSENYNGTLELIDAITKAEGQGQEAVRAGQQQVLQLEQEAESKAETLVSHAIKQGMALVAQAEERGAIEAVAQMPQYTAELTKLTDELLKKGEKNMPLAIDYICRKVAE